MHGPTGVVSVVADGFDERSPGALTAGPGHQVAERELVVVDDLDDGPRPGGTIVDKNLDSVQAGSGLCGAGDELEEDYGQEPGDGDGGRGRSRVDAGDSGVENDAGEENLADGLGPRAGPTGGQWDQAQGNGSVETLVAAEKAGDEAGPRGWSAQDLSLFSASSLERAGPISMG